MSALFNTLGKNMFEIINFWMPEVHGGGGHSGGVASSVNQFLIFLDILSGKSAAEIFALLMPGIAAMENIHPLFVHFPIALLTGFTAIDILGSALKKPEWRKAASWFLYLGVIMAGFTVAAGLAAEESVAHGGNVHDIMERHETLALTVLSLSVILALWRLLNRGLIEGTANVFYLLFAVVMNIVLIFTADFGGLMVYKYGVSVQAAHDVNEALFQQHNHSTGSTETNSGHGHSHADGHSHTHAH